MTTIGQVMNPNVLWIDSAATLAEAIDVLYAHDCGGAPVVSVEGEILGMISENSILDVLFDIASLQAPVSEFMTRQVHVIGPDDSLEHVAHMFELYSIRRLPVLESGRLVGIVTRRDLIRHVLAAHESLGDPLEAILPRVAAWQA